MDYDTLANALESRSKAAAAFLRIQSSGRRNRVHKTTARTVFDKLRARGVTLTMQQAESLLHLYAELGLGNVGKQYSMPEIKWADSVSILQLGACLTERARKFQAVRTTPSVSKGRMIVCMIPSGSHDALMAAGLDKHLGIELFHS